MGNPRLDEQRGVKRRTFLRNTAAAAFAAPLMASFTLEGVAAAKDAPLGAAIFADLQQAFTIGMKALADGDPARPQVLEVTDHVYELLRSGPAGNVGDLCHKVDEFGRAVTRLRPTTAAGAANKSALLAVYNKMQTDATAGGACS